MARPSKLTKKLQLLGDSAFGQFIGAHSSTPTSTPASAIISKQKRFKKALINNIFLELVRIF